MLRHNEHSTSVLLLALASAVLLSGCGGSADTPDYVETGPPPLTARTIGEQALQRNADYLAAAPYATADTGRGERIAMLCRACHSLERGGSNMIGPNLYGFFGNSVGSVENFGYSAATSAVQFIWTPRALDAWLAQPALFLPGTSMTFAGIRNAGDRDALIAFLLQVTDDQSMD